MKHFRSLSLVAATVLALTLNGILTPTAQGAAIKVRKLRGL